MMPKSKLDAIIEAFNVPEDSKGEQINDEEVEDGAQELNEEDIKSEVKDVKEKKKESDDSGNSEPDLSNVE